MRGPVLDNFPPPPGIPKDVDAYLRDVDGLYVNDAYNSLSIEGYRVSAELIERVYEGDADVDSNSIEVIIGRLRRKIGAAMIETVRGRGYRLTAERA